MTYNVFGGTLNLAQSIKATELCDLHQKAQQKSLPTVKMTVHFPTR